MINWSEPGATPDVGFTELELYLLDTLIRDKAGADSIRNRWPTYLIKLARLGRLPWGILLPLNRSTPRSRQILLIECLAYQRLDYRLSTDIQLFGSRIQFFQHARS